MPRLDANDALALQSAADRLAAGELVAFPTETVYGLGARADDDRAVARIFAAKGRPAAHPLIVHVCDEAQAMHFAAHWPPLAQRLARAFWPGPLTLIVERASERAAAAAGGQRTIGLRASAHPVAQKLLAEAARRGVPGVAAPSANRFGRVSATAASHVVDEFGGDLAVLDGGRCPGGIESTIVDCSGARPVLLRPGLLPRERIEAALQAPLAERDADSPRFSGGLRSHYAPAAKLRLMQRRQLGDALAVLQDLPPALKLAVYSRPGLSLVRGILYRPMPDNAAAVAHELFAVLREFDAEGAKLVWIEQPPFEAQWEGVLDRLQRAAAD